MRSLDIHKENEADVFNILYGRIRKDTPVFRYKIVDVVRVSKVRYVFSKGYEQNYTEESHIKNCIFLKAPTNTSLIFYGKLAIILGLKLGVSVN